MMSQIEGETLRVISEMTERLMSEAHRLVVNSDRDEDLILCGIIRDSALKIRWALANHSKDSSRREKALEDKDRFYG